MKSAVGLLNFVTGVKSSIIMCNTGNFIINHFIRLLAVCVKFGRGPAPDELSYCDNLTLKRSKN